MDREIVGTGALDPALAREAMEAIASARELLSELIDEGVDHFDRIAAEPVAAPVPQPTPVQPEVAAREPVSVATQASQAKTVGPAASHTTLEVVRAELGDCQRCDLCGERKTIVFGDGDPNARLMFVGEGPGEQEDLRGLPFVGRAGELLTQMIEKGLGIPRSSVYICNIVKCRPPNNRTPLPNEVAACRPFLDGQIDAIRPKAIVALGKPASSLLLGRDVAITRVRGTWQQYRDIPVMPTLHPAYVLRQYTDENRRNVWEDLKAAQARAEQD
jgi:uracil-DNA glycosylase family 4